MTIQHRFTTLIVAAAIGATSIMPLSGAAVADGVRYDRGGAQHSFRRGGHRVEHSDRRFERRQARRAQRRAERRRLARAERRAERRAARRHAAKASRHHHRRKRDGISGPAAVAIGVGIVALAIIAANAERRR